HLEREQIRRADAIVSGPVLGRESAATDEHRVKEHEQNWSQLSHRGYVPSNDRFVMNRKMERLTPGMFEESFVWVTSARSEAFRKRFAETPPPTAVERSFRLTKIPPVGNGRG